MLKFLGCAENNLKMSTFPFHWERSPLLPVCPVQGNSSLVNEIINKYLSKELNRAHSLPGKFKKAEGVENLDKIIDIDQSPIGRTPRSNPATYTGVFR